MASTKKSTSARVAAGIGAAAIATLMVLGGAFPASAAGPNLDADERGSITIHKFAEPTETAQLGNDGLPLAAGDLSGLTPLGGVGFQAVLVPGTDLSTTAGWERAAALEADVNRIETAQALTDGVAPARSGVTGAIGDPDSGQLELLDLALGVYLVTETGSGGNSIAITSEPFLVSVPMANPNTAEWMYDVHVYPKNSMTTITKDVDESAARGLGSAVSWTISVDVPEVGQNALTEFRIQDEMDDRLEFVSASLAVSQAGTTPTAPRLAVDLAFGTDYRVSDGPNYEIEFLAPGLTKLAALNDGVIDIVVTTRVIGLGDGTIENTATLIVNGNEFDATDVTGWASLEILKHHIDNAAAVLGGAQFQVFASEADAASGANAIAVSGSTTFTSDATTGIASAPGLRAGTYWVVETVAPVGYVLDSEPHEVTLVAGDVDATVELSIGNSPVPAYELPITGGTGQAAFMIGGAGLLAAALGFALFRRRKADAEV